MDATTAERSLRVAYHEIFLWSMLLVVIGKQNVWQVCIFMVETKNAAFILEEKWSAKYGGNQKLNSNSCE